MRPQIKTVSDHRNKESTLFKNLEYEKISKNIPQKFNIKTFEQIRKSNPNIDFLKDKVDFGKIIRKGILIFN